MKKRTIAFVSLVPLAALAAGLTFRRMNETIPPARPLQDGPDTLRLVFIGDAMMHEEQIKKAFDHNTGEYSFDGYLSGIEDIIKDADFCVANAEFTLGGKPYSGYPAFSAPESYPEYLSKMGVDLFLTANNHILDKGKAGLGRTLEEYARRGLRYTGSALSEEEDKDLNPLIVPVRGVRVAFVNVTYGTNVPDKGAYPKTHTLDTTDTGALIDRAKAKGADIIIALPHWGTEYALAHSSSQAMMAKFFARRGCDAVVGSHPHVVQDTDTIDGMSVTYSLGNIISNMSATDTQVGLITTLRIAVDTDRHARVLEPRYDFTWCSRPNATGSGYRTIRVRDHINEKASWQTEHDYSKMLSSYKRVKAATGIID